MSDEPRSLSTDLSKVRYLGPARSGVLESWRMRLTSAALIPLSIAFIWLVLSLIGKDYNSVRATLGSPFESVLMLLFILSGVYHMELGMRSIILDYVHGDVLKEWTLTANTWFCICIGLACIYAVLRIGFA